MTFPIAFIPDPPDEPVAIPTCWACGGTGLVSVECGVDGCLIDHETQCEECEGRE